MLAASFGNRVVPVNRYGTEVRAQRQILTSLVVRTAHALLSHSRVPRRVKGLSQHALRTPGARHDSFGEPTVKLFLRKFTIGPQWDLHD